MALVDELNRVQYISEDFDTYRSEANQFFQTNYPTTFNNVIATDLGNALMDQLAFAMQALAFMINRRSSELFLQTARLTSSIVKLAKMLGYPIAPASPATTTLTITFPNAPYTYPIPIAPGFQWQGPGTVIYEYSNSVSGVSAILNPGETTLTIPITEGITKQISFTSDGTPNQSFSIFGIPTGQFLYSDGMLLTVDGVAWQLLKLLSYQATNIYEVLFTDNPPVLDFGDGIAGNIPPLNSSIVLVYRYGQGLAGTISSNQISGPVVPLVVNGNTIPMNVTNLVADAGSNPEAIEHVKLFASSFFRTQNAAVVKSDYDTIAQLQPGVALADAQIMRGIDQDLTIQSDFTQITQGEAILLDAVSAMAQSGVTGQSFLGVANVSGLFVNGTSGLGVSGTSGLFVSNISFLGVSGIQYLGTDVSGHVTGTGFLGVSGVGTLAVGGTSGLGVSGESSLFVDNEQLLSVSGISSLGVSGQFLYVSDATSGVTLINDAVSGLSAYLSQELSDTSQANQVQVIVLSVDANNNYISPSTQILQNVQSTLQSLADAVVTVVAVDGSPNLVPVNLKVEMGISQTAVQTNVETTALQALISSTSPYGLLVLRSAGKSLYLSDIQTAIMNAVNPGDVIYLNVQITGPSQYIDQYGNLVIGLQKIVTPGTMSVKAIQRFLSNGTTVPLN